MAPLVLIVFFGVLASVAHSEYCDSTRPFACGKLRNITSPFWKRGQNQANCWNTEFELLHCDDLTEFPSISIQNQTFRVQNIHMGGNTMTLSLPFDDPCDSLNLSVKNISQVLQGRLLSSSAITVFSGCEHVKTDLPPEWCPFSCGWQRQDWVHWGMNTDPLPLPLLKLCKNHFEVAVMNDTRLDNSTALVWWGEDLLASLRHGVERSFSPLPPPPSQPPVPSQQSPSKGKLKMKTALQIGFSVSGATVFLMCAIFAVYRGCRKATCVWHISSDPTVTDSEKIGALYGVKYFSYKELEEATDNFSESKEIGDGGFGRVYLGKLRDGRTVAIKRLYENNWRRVEQFLNEVEILARLRHKNLVMLYGCTSRHSRELLVVYEYISNGTVADHLHGKDAKTMSLSWDMRLKIAVETASALKYLHASDVVHRDIKTNNVLLDSYFNVKVADFGLSRLFPLNVSHVSTAPQGTPGYVDPEYRQCYQLTDKSDVYSFGVVLAELISSKPAVDIRRHRHEINLSNMAINKIQNNALDEFVDPSLGFDSDANVREMIIGVAELAFQCLQGDRDMRPSMAEVLENLTRIQLGESQTENKVEELDKL